MTPDREPGVDEPTIIAHRPIGPTRAGGGRRGAAPPPAADLPFATPAPPRARATDEGTPERPGTQGSLTVPVPDEPKNEEDLLLAAATPLLVVVAHLRAAVQRAEVAALRKEMVDQIRRFEERAVRFGAKGNDVSAARYVLCSLIDETVMTTPWGSSSNWSSSSLLLEFHSETWGGEKVFQILDRLRGEPAKYIALLKLVDVCLLLGFEGKYRVLDNGRDQLNDLRLELARLMRQIGKRAPQDLSPHWRGVERVDRIRRFVPLWVVFSVAALLILSSYGYARWRMASDLSPAVEALDNVAKS